MVVCSDVMEKNLRSVALLRRSTTFIHMIAASMIDLLHIHPSISPPSSLSLSFHAALHAHTAATDAGGGNVKVVHNIAFKFRKCRSIITCRAHDPMISAHHRKKLFLISPPPSCSYFPTNKTSSNQDFLLAGRSVGHTLGSALGGKILRRRNWENRPQHRVLQLES